MLRLCPTSCGLCTPECKDLHDDCPGWGSNGECNENPEFMIRNCPVTCEACKSTCRDFKSDCPGWTADGECFKNPGFMYKECPNSCGVCEGVKCADGNQTQCKIWADAGECLNNPLAVMKECPDACGVRRRRPAAPAVTTAGPSSTVASAPGPLLGRARRALLRARPT